MLNILSTLNGQDLGFLKIIANAWGIEIKAPDSYTARTHLAAEMDNPEIIKEIFEALPEDARNAFNSLLELNGKIPWAKFSREFGEIQVMGSAKRDRERPDLKPKSPTEYLWYRAFIGRAFLGMDSEPQEFAYIPEEIFSCLEPIHIQKKQIPGRKATPKETQFIQHVSDKILNDLCTVLAMYRNNLPIEEHKDLLEIPVSFLRVILTDMKLVSANGTVDPDQIRLFLEAPGETALIQIVKYWLESIQINEMEFVPSLVIEGMLDHNSVKTRKFLIDQISLIPSDLWWNLESFVYYVYQTNPDFQRPAGNYDTWYIKDPETGEYLRGFENWHRIDGAFIRYMVTGPLHWLGLIDLSSTSAENQPVAFKCSTQCIDLLSNQPPKGIITKEEKIHIDSYGKILIPFHFSRAIRYQVSRFCEWNGRSKDGYIYNISPKSLNRSKDQGLKISHFLKLVQSSLTHSFPPKLKHALERWEQNGTQAYFSNVVLLKVSDPEAITQLQTSPVNKFIQAILNPNTAAINPNGMEQIRKTLIELGYLSE